MQEIFVNEMDYGSQNVTNSTIRYSIPHPTQRFPSYPPTSVDGLFSQTVKSIKVRNPLSMVTFENGFVFVIAIVYQSLHWSCHISSAILQMPRVVL